MTEPPLPLPSGATVLEPPPKFALWWSLTEACSGLQRDMSAVTWYVVTGASSISDRSGARLAGYYSPAANSIVLADTGVLTGPEIRHEMLHAILGPFTNGHPRDEFLGRCAGTVDCVLDCVTDAGPPPPPDPAAVTVDPDALRITTAADPIAPSEAIDGSWFTLNILVTNPRSTPVIVNLTPAGDGGPPTSFSWDMTCLGSIECPGVGYVVWDRTVEDLASVNRFAAGETKRFVFDFRDGGNWAWSIPPAVYVFRGYYNGRNGAGIVSKPDTVTLSP